MSTRSFKSIPDLSVIDYKLVASLCSILLGHEAWSDTLCSHEVAGAVWSLLVDAAREGWSAQTVRAKMEADSGDTRLAEVLESAFEKYGSELRSQLHTIRWDYSEVVGIDWTVKKTVESDVLARVSEPTVSFQLQSIPLGADKSTEIRFDCDARQLQDLHWKVKEALNSIKLLEAKR